MNKNKIIPLMILSTAISLWTLSGWTDPTAPSPSPSPTDPIVERDGGFLGEIRYSILTEEQFQKLYGKDWVLMDGRDIPETKLATQFKWNKLPDARGLFLRAKNNGRNPQTNPDGELGIGAYQGDQFTKHNHGIRLECGPIHPNATTCSPPGSQYNYVNGNGLYPHHQTHETISATGGEETRPRNLTVNVFIKVDESLKTTQIKVMEDSITREIRKLPEELIGNKAFLKLIDKYIKESLEKSK